MQLVLIIRRTLFEYDHQFSSCCTVRYLAGTAFIADSRTLLCGGYIIRREARWSTTAGCRVKVGNRFHFCVCAGE